MARAKSNPARYPRSRLDKLGVKEGDRVGLQAFQDAAFERELADRSATAVKGRTATGLPMVLCAFREVGELERLGELRGAITPNGCVWALWPKGRRELREDDVRAAALAAGLVDVKVMAFSEVLSGLKLVIPKAQREKTPPPRAAKPAATSRLTKEGTEEVTAVVRLRTKAPATAARRPAAKRAKRHK